MTTAQQVQEAKEALSRKQAQSDRAFARLMKGEVKTSAAAVRLAREVEEAQADYDLARYSWISSNE